MFKIIFSLLSFNCIFSQIPVGQNLYGENFNQQFGWSNDISDDGNILAVGSNIGNNSDFKGNVKIYEKINNIWIQKGQTIIGEFNNEYCGYSISLSKFGNIIAIGYVGYNNSSGRVKVFQFNNNNWTQIGQDLIGGNIGNQLGSKVVISKHGNILAIRTNSSNVKTYELVNNVWNQFGQEINDYIVSNQLGVSISFSEDASVMALGAAHSDINGTNSGLVKIYKYINNNWEILGQELFGENSGNQFGYSNKLSRSGDIIAIGAWFNNGNGLSSGQVKIFKLLNNNWTQIGQSLYGEYPNDQFGTDLDLSSNGEVLVVGAIKNDNNGINSGCTKVFRYVNNNWIQICNINGTLEGEHSGYSVAISENGNYISIGSYICDYPISNTGLVRVFDLSAILSSNSFVLSNFSVYPNPTSETLTIELENNLILEKVNIYNTLGQIIKTESNTNIDVSKLQKGTYFVEVITNQGKATKSIIIN